MKLLSGFFRFIGRGIYNAFLAMFVLTIIGGGFVAVANYTMTQGLGTTFASSVIGGANYALFVLCDATLGAAQCQTVNGSGQALVLASQSGAPWTATINQGGNSALVKAGNTGGVADQALVVADPNVLAAVQAAIPTGANTIGSVGLVANPTGGCTPGSIITTITSNSTTTLKGSAGTLCEFSIISYTTSLVDVRLYDSATPPTCSSATGKVGNYPIVSATTSAMVGISANVGPFGKLFANGISFCATGVNADNDNTNATSSVNINYSYK